MTNTSQNIELGTVFLTSSVDPTSGFIATATVIDGSYTLTDISDGSYYVTVVYATANSILYIGEAYDGITCRSPICNYEQATPVTVSGGGAVTGIDFILSPGGRITGTVNDGTNPLPGSTLIYLLDETGALSTLTTSEADGSYRLDALIPGTYYVVAENSAGYQSALFGGGPCSAFSCTVTSGTPINVVGGQTSENVNIVLPLGATVSGVVTDAKTRNPLTMGGVNIYNSKGVPVGQASVNSDGTYLFGPGFPTGKYSFAAFSEGYIPELLEDISCDGGCTFKTGKKIPLKVGKNSVVKFALSPAVKKNFPELRAEFMNISSSGGTLIIENTGKLTASSFRVFVYRSSRKNLSGNFKLLKKEKISLLKKGENKSIQFNSTPDPARPFYIARIDADLEVREKNEKNNTIAIAIP